MGLVQATRRACQQNVKKVMVAPATTSWWSWKVSARLERSHGVVFWLIGGCREGRGGWSSDMSLRPV